MITNKDLKYLKRAVELAKIALDNGDQPFGSVLVGQDGQILFEDHNHVKDGDHTRHPEFEIAKWAMLGRIVYASSSKQLTTWLSELGVKTGRVKTLKNRRCYNRYNNWRTGWWTLKNNQAITCWLL